MGKLVQRNRVFLTISFSFLAFSAFATVCRNDGVEGFERYAEHAHHVLPANTSDPTKAAIYIENTPKGLYYHSNFITPGYDFEYPTKIAGEKVKDIKTAFKNIRYAEMPDELEENDSEEILKNDVHIFLDSSLFSEGGYPEVDLTGARRVTIVNGRTGQMMMSGSSIESLSRKSPPPLLISKVLGCCFYGIPPHLAPHYQAALEKRSFDAGNVRFISLVRDSGTERAIAASSRLNALRLGDQERATQTIAQIESAFRLAQGKTVVLLSHVEENNFVVRDPAGTLVSSIPIDSVRNLARQYQIELIDLGCQTAQQIRTDTLGLGVTTTFNTVEAVQSLERALSQSHNYADFFGNLTSERLKVVVDGGFVRGWPLCADVYAKGTGTSIWVKLARVFVSFRQGQQGAMGVSVK